MSMNLAEPSLELHSLEICLPFEMLKTRMCYAVIDTGPAPQMYDHLEPELLRNLHVITTGAYKKMHYVAKILEKMPSDTPCPLGAGSCISRYIE